MPKMPVFKVNRIEPTCWFVGMKDPSVQLMVYGDGIRDAEVSTNSLAPSPAQWSLNLVRTNSQW